MMHQPARNRSRRRADPTFLLAFLLPVFAWAHLTYPGYFVFRSGFLPIFNLAGQMAHFGDLAWAPAVGARYSLLGGDGPLPYWLGALPAAFGTGPANAVKWVFGLSLLAASVGAYLWARRRLQLHWPALVAATLYVFNPIALRLVYTDGAFAQAVLLALMPWLLWAAEAAVSGGRGAVVALTLFASAALWSQAGLGLVFIAVVLVYLLVLRLLQRLTVRGFAVGALALAGGLLLGGLGLLPSALRYGLGPAIWQASGWPALLTPWLALFGGWLAARLGAMLPEHGSTDRTALFAALLALAVLFVYRDVQPVATATQIPNAPLAIFGDNEIALLSVRAEGTPGPSGSVALEVEWQALKPLSRDYTVFFHVITGNDQRFGQLDTMPQGGALPTSHWQPGEVVRDRYEAKLAPAASISPDYRYWLGWYFGETGERLAVHPGAATQPDDKYIINP